MAARREDRLRALADRIIAMGREALVIVADVARADQAAAIIDQTPARFGRLDILLITCRPRTDSYSALFNRREPIDRAECR